MCVGKGGGGSCSFPNRHCHLSPVEHAALTSWLSLLETQQLERSVAASRAPVVMEDGSEFFDILPKRSNSAAGNAEMLADLSGLEQALPSTTYLATKRQQRLRCPPCIRGQISGVKGRLYFLWKFSKCLINSYRNI